MNQIKESDDETITKIDFKVNSELVDSYTELIRKKDILKKVLEELEIKDVTVEELKKGIQIIAETNTGVIKIKVTNSNAEYAAKIANKLAQVFDKEVADTYIQNDVSVIDEAEVSEKSSNINHKKDIVLFVAIGIVLAGGYALIRYMFEEVKI